VKLSFIEIGVESDHTQMLQAVSDKITEISVDDSVSQVSSHSKDSRMSNKSNVSQKSNAMIKAAVLKAKLKYIDWEAKAKADLEKVETLQTLHVEEAKMEAI
jgi:hypothetical protein